MPRKTWLVGAEWVKETMRREYGRDVSRSEHQMMMRHLATRVPSYYTHREAIALGLTCQLWLRKEVEAYLIPHLREKRASE